MYLHPTYRRKDGKAHRYFTVVESVRLPGAKHPVQRPLLYLGELNDSQQAAWSKALLVCDTVTQQTQPLRLFPDDRTPPPDPIPALQVHWQDYALRRPRAYGDCWLALELWRLLGLDEFWTEKLGWTRAGTDWAKTLLVSVAYRLIAPGSEWRCWRLWYERTALGDLLGPDFHLGGKDQLYTLLDKLLPHPHRGATDRTARQHAARALPCRHPAGARQSHPHPVAGSALAASPRHGRSEALPRGQRTLRRRQK